MPQTFENHARTDPPFHFFMAPVAIATVVMAIIRLVNEFNWTNCWLVVLSIAFVVAVFKIRLYALQVQNRLIHLEERLRYERLLKEPLLSRAGELSVGQCVALRFASDAELPGLVEQALANGWKNKDIKKSIRNWRPDEYRV